MDNGKNTVIINEIRQLTDDLIKKMSRPRYVFTLDRNKCALVIIDMQNFVCAPDKTDAFPAIDSVIENINRLAEYARKLEIPVIWIRQNFTGEENKNDAGLFPLFHGKKLDENLCNFRSGTEISSRMAYNSSKDTVVTKNRYSAFIQGSSKLPDILNSLQKNQLIVAGAASNVCVESSIRDAMQMGFQVVLARDATCTFSEIFREMTFANIRLFFGDVKNSGEIMDDLKKT